MLFINYCYFFWDSLRAAPDPTAAAAVDLFVVVVHAGVAQGIGVGANGADSRGTLLCIVLHAEHD